MADPEELGLRLSREDALLIREGIFAEPGGPAPVDAMDRLLAALNAALSTEGGQERPRTRTPNDDPVRSEQPQGEGR